MIRGKPKYKMIKRKKCTIYNNLESISGIGTCTIYIKAFDMKHQLGKTQLILLEL